MRRVFDQADLGVRRAAFWAALRWAALALARLRLSLTFAAPRGAGAPSMVRPAQSARTSATGGGGRSTCGAAGTAGRGVTAVFPGTGTSARCDWQRGHCAPTGVSLLITEIITHASDKTARAAHWAGSLSVPPGGAAEPRPPGDGPCRGVAGDAERVRPPGAERAF